MILSDEDKIRIEAEEKFRVETRTKLEEQEKKAAAEIKRKQDVKNFFGGLILIAGVIFLIAQCVPTQTPQQRAEEMARNEKRDCEHSISAILMSQKFVAKKLKSPSTATFPDLSDKGIVTKYLGDCTHEVVSYVDAQNTFGGIVRSTYYAKVKYIGNDKWNQLAVKVE